MTDQNHCEEQLIKAFEMMCGKFSEPVMLIHRDRTVIAANELCLGFGMTIGVKCNAVQPERHKGCRANEALDKNETCTLSYKLGDNSMTSYWVPVSGAPDYFIHFGIGTLEAMKAAQRG